MWAILLHDDKSVQNVLMCSDTFLVSDSEPIGFNQ